VLLAAFYARCGMVTFHGPVVTSLAVSDPETKAMLKAVISSPFPLTYDLSRPVVIRPGIARGRVMGGNLCTLCHLAGTAFAPDVAGCILFLEDWGEPPYKIDRMLTQLKMCGWLEAIAGLIIGSFERCGDEAMVFRIVEELFEKSPIPVMGGFEIGHGARNLILPIGLEAILDTSRGQLAFCRPATSPAGGADEI
jgi:muramoyltetrapeptide carboxypeptidase